MAFESYHRRKTKVRTAVFVASLLLALALVPARAEVVDRTIAVVNNHLVTWSDLDEQMRFEALQNRRALKDLGGDDRRAAFEHLVQYWILRDQMQGTLPATDAAVEARIAELRANRDDSQWIAALERYGLSMGELRELVRNQLEILSFVDFRVRPLAGVSRAEVEDYYRDTLAPQVMEQGQTPEPLEAVRTKIRELLVEQKMNQEMEKWLQNLRAQSRVQILWDGVR